MTSLDSTPSPETPIPAAPIPATPDLATAIPAAPNPAAQIPAAPDLATSNPAAPNPAAPGLATSNPAAPIPAAPGPRKKTDLVVSIVLVLLAVAVNLGVSVAGFTLVMMSDACNDSCNVAFFSGGVLFATFAPSVVTVIGIILTIIRVVRRKRAFWVPLATIGGQVVALILGALVVFGSIGQL